MTKYFLMYYGGKRPSSPVEFASIMETWRNWTAEMGSAVIDSGNPFSQAAEVTSDGRTDTTAEVPSGYSIIQAEDMQRAIEIAQTTPVVEQGGRAVVYESFKVI